MNIQVEELKNKSKDKKKQTKSAKLNFLNFLRENEGYEEAKEYIGFFDKKMAINAQA